MSGTLFTFRKKESNQSGQIHIKHANPSSLDENVFNLYREENRTLKNCQSELAAERSNASKIQTKGIIKQSA
jgi:hypothetical protein